MTPDRFQAELCVRVITMAQFAIFLFYRAVRRKGRTANGRRTMRITLIIRKTNVDFANYEAGRIVWCVSIGANFRNNIWSDNKSDRF